MHQFLAHVVHLSLVHLPEQLCLVGLQPLLLFLHGFPGHGINVLQSLSLALVCLHLLFLEVGKLLASIFHLFNLVLLGFSSESFSDCPSLLEGCSQVFILLDVGIVDLFI